MYITTFEIAFNNVNIATKHLGACKNLNHPGFLIINTTSVAETDIVSKLEHTSFLHAFQMAIEHFKLSSNSTLKIDL